MKIGVLFPGYGSQHVGMAKELYDDYRIIQDYFEEATNCLNVNFVKLCFASSDSELGRMHNAYTSTFLVSSAVYALLKQEGIQADACAGYNLGEYAALHAAGGITFPDGLYLLNKYATLYQEAVENMDVGLLRVQGIATGTLRTLCEQASHDDAVASIAITNSLTDHVISGNTAAIEQVRGELAQDTSVVIKELPVEVGLHSALMNPITNNLAMYLEKVDFKDLTTPVVCSAENRLIEHGDQVRARIIEHSDTEINWENVVRACAAYDLLIEVGPGSMLTDMVKAKYPDKLCMSINKRSDLIDLKKLIEVPPIEPETP